jgi:hypothetical protein
MPLIYTLVPVIADVIAAHCRGTRAREAFMCACVNGRWDEAGAMIEGMLAEPWQLRGYQEHRLRDFQELLQLSQGGATTDRRRAIDMHHGSNCCG